MRELLTLILLVCLPLHALLVTLGTKLIFGPGFAPFSMLALWKEALLGLILVIAFFEILHALATRRASLNTHVDTLDLCILGLIALSIIVTLYHWPVSTGRLALGIKYDFVPLISFLILRRVQWSDVFHLAVQIYILILGTLVSVYGLLTLVLPDAFFRALGYSDAHSLYIVNKPLAAFQQIAESGVRRIQSTFSGPNQLGLWLLLPWSFGVVWFMDAFMNARKWHWKNLLFWKKHENYTLGIERALAFLLLVGAALFFSFSRSAWIGAFVILVSVIGLSIPREMFRKVITISGVALVLLGIVVTLAFPKVFFRLSSSRGHIEHPIQAWQRMWASPLGEGLGAVGPASARGSDTCVILRPQDDPSWAKSSPSLCVFLGEGKQVQPDPATYTCKCPWHPENWYLQLGVELGVVGFVLFLVLTVMMIITGIKRMGMHPAVLAFLGVSIGALFLHAWEDAAVAYTIWLLLASVLPSGKTRHS